MARNHIISKIASGTHNKLPNYEIPKDSSQDALNWVTVDGGIVLALGKQIVGVEGANGEVRNLWYGTRNDATKVLYVKHGITISYWNGTTLVAIVTGLTSNATYSFQNYTSLAGNFTFAFGIDGIYKFHNASLGSYIDMYDSTKNWKGGRALIDKGRTLLVGIPTDPTGLYGSKIDAQGTNYTTVASESIGTGDGVQTVFTGTLAFKGSNPKANCFGLTITQGANVSKDGYNGVITGTNISIGTINYITGAYSITFTTPPPNLQALTIGYQWENSNTAGVTDFTKSTPRLASEGFVARQDIGGDAIQNIVIGTDGAYYSAKLYSFYRFFMDETDTKPTNDVFRTDIGIPSAESVISAGIGIIFMNTANPNNPQMTLLEKNPLGDSLVPIVLFEHFAFENYKYDQCVLDTWDRFILVSCRTADSPTNNRLLLCDKAGGTVDITSHGMRCLAKDGINLYGGSSLTQTVWQLFGDYDDDGAVLDNYWESKNDECGIDSLKKTRTWRFKGFIEQNQKIEVSVGYDDSEPTLIGTIRGDGEYVDKSKPNTVGGFEVGSLPIGGSEVQTVYPYYLEIKTKVPKFETRTVKFEAKELGYASVNYIEDHDILTYEGRMPKRNRLKQNVSLDGSNTNT